MSGTQQQKSILRVMREYFMSGALSLIFVAVVAIIAVFVEGVNVNGILYFCIPVLAVIGAVFTGFGLSYIPLYKLLKRSKHGTVETELTPVRIKTRRVPVTRDSMCVSVIYFYDDGCRRWAYVPTRSQSNFLDKETLQRLKAPLKIKYVKDTLLITDIEGLTDIDVLNKLFK